VSPDFSAINGTTIQQVIGALLTIVLVCAVATAVICAISWAVSHATGNWQLAGKSRTGLLVALGVAAGAGGGVAWMNWLLTTGSHL